MRREIEELPRREEFETLARYYHHVQNEHKRAAPEGRVRRRLEDRLLDVHGDSSGCLPSGFETTISRVRGWITSTIALSPPRVRPPIRPLVFRGQNEAGAVAEIRRKDDELAVTVDGTLAERLHVKDFPSDGRPDEFRVSETTFTETFTASAEALRELSDFLDDGDRQPPWDYAAELLADGLIDVYSALTPRGRRALDASSK